MSSKLHKNKHKCYRFSISMVIVSNYIIYIATKHNNRAYGRENPYVASLVDLFIVDEAWYTNFYLAMQHCKNNTCNGMKL